MPLIEQARSLEVLSSRIRDVDMALERDGTYGDARDELEAALSHMRVAWLILRAPDEDDSGGAAE
jgi:hypothetical protein